MYLIAILTLMSAFTLTDIKDKEAVCAMDMKTFIISLLGKAEFLYDERKAWDTIWGNILQIILKEGEIPVGSIADMITEVKKYVKTSETLSYIIKSKCRRFLSSNRVLGPVYSELWCTVKHKDGTATCFHKDSLHETAHAEIQALRYLNHLKDGEKSQKVKVYLNMSPCSNCSEEILQFVHQNPGVKLKLLFTSVFGFHGENHQQGLRSLLRSGVKLAVFQDEDWQQLSDCVEFADIGAKKRKYLEKATMNPTKKVKHSC